MNSVECPVCGNHRFKMVFTVKDHFVTHEEFPIHACIRCGMMITSSLPGQAEFGRYYKSEDYISHSDTRQGLVNKAYHAVREIMLNIKLRTIRKVSQKKTGTLLDIGTGTGYFLNHMKNNGWKVSGTERDESARKFALERWGIDVRSDEELFTFEPYSFDVITLWHVMEHLPSIEQHWKILSKLLKPDGVLIIALPNAGSFDAHHYGKYWAAWDVPRHLWHFAPDHISELGQKHGFRLTRLKRMPFDSFYISIMSEKYKGSSMPLFKGIFWGKISWLSSIINPRKCSSLIYIFKKTV